MGLRFFGFTWTGSTRIHFVGWRSTHSLGIKQRNLTKKFTLFFSPVLAAGIMLLFLDLYSTLFLTGQGISLQENLLHHPIWCYFAILTMSFISSGAAIILSRWIENLTLGSKKPNGTHNSEVTKLTKTPSKMTQNG